MYQATPTSHNWNISNTLRMTLNASGNLGLGVTPSAWYSGSNSKAIEVSGAGNAFWAYGSTSNINTYITNNAYYDSVGFKYGQSGGGASAYRQNDGVHQWYTAPSGTAGNAISFTQAMTLNASGQLLLNRTSSFNSGTYTGQKLQVTGGIGINSDSADGVARLTLLGSSATGDGTIDWGGNGNFNLVFSNNGSERMRINASGNVSIGNTNDTYKLDVTGTGRFTASAYFATSSGSVGIGTTSPARKLEVYAVDPSFALKSSTTTGYSELYFADSASDSVGFISYAHSTDSMVLGTSGSTRLTIASTGAATFSSSVTATGGFEIPNGQFYRARRSSGSLLTDMIGIPSGTDDVRILTTGDFNVINGSLSNILTVKNNGSVGIGTTSPSVKLQVEDSSSTSLTTLYLVNSSTAAVTTKQNNLSFRMTDTVGTRKNAFQLTAYSDSSGGNIENGGLIFSGRKADLDTEFMRITSGGSVIVNGTSSAYNSVRQQIWFTGASTQYGLSIAALNTGNTNFIDFNIGSGSSGFAGSISWNGSTVAYNTSSDYRLKQNFKDYSGLDLINKIKTYDYEWKADKSRSYGVIAHELQSVINYAVTGEKDGKEMQGVDYSKIVPVLIKAIQELNDKIK
jgi:hypothetical protein